MDIERVQKKFIKSRAIWEGRLLESLLKLIGFSWIFVLPTKLYNVVTKFFKNPTGNLIESTLIYR